MMSPTVEKRSEKAGLPPGTLVHVGRKRTEEVKISLIDYDEVLFQEKEVEKIEETFPFKDSPTVTWVNIDGLHDTDIIQKIGARFDIHQLILEDIANTGQRPKFEDGEDYFYIVLKMFYFRDKDKKICYEQISMILGPNYVISFQEAEGDIFDTIRERIRTGKGRIRKMGADYLAYALIDAVVDNYFAILEGIGETIESLEEELVEKPTPETLQATHFLRRELAYLRKAVWPLREVVSGLEKSESPLIDKSTRIFFRDIYDHTIQVIDTVETFRDMVSGVLDVYLSSVSNKMNEVMKVLTIIATIFIPLTFIAGIYGMNFVYMPELQWRLGYAMIWGVIVVIATAMVFYFKKRKWL